MALDKCFPLVRPHLSFHLLHPSLMGGHVKASHSLRSVEMGRSLHPQGLTDDHVPPAV